ncbi:MAG: LysR family transcriptional regulator [Bdellovibrionota bacterium]
MTLDQILVFKEISKQGTLRAAAGILNRSQPAVSTALKNLEEQVGFQLFDRSGYRPALTAHGERFLHGVDLFLEAQKDLEELAQDLRGDCEPKLVIAIDSACPLDLVIPKIQDAVAPFKGLELEFKFGVVTQSVQQVLAGEADLAIAPLMTQLEALETRPLLKQRLIPAIHKRFLPKGQSKIELSELRKIPNIIVTSGQKDSPFGVPGLRSGKKLTVSNHAVKEQMILMGLGWGRIPEERLESRPYSEDLVAIRNKELPPVTLEIALLWKRGQRLGRAARKVREKLEELAL